MNNVIKTASKAFGATTLAVKPGVRVTWSTYDLASRYQLVEQTGQLDMVDRRHLIYVIRPVVRLAEPRRRQRSPEIVEIQTPPGSTVRDGRSQKTAVYRVQRTVDT